VDSGISPEEWQRLPHGIFCEANDECSDPRTHGSALPPGSYGPWPQVEAEAKPLPTDSREPADTAADVVKLDVDCDASPADLADLALG
jgi:hypothetical protein